MVPGLDIVGQLIKLNIQAFLDKDFKQPAGTYSVMFNPESFTKTFEVEQKRRKGKGKSGHETEFFGMKPQQFSFDFIVDGTGASGIKVFVDSEIKKFIDTVYKYEGKIHRNKYLILNWGSEIFKCVVRKVDVNYTMFSPIGTPLRATIKAVFDENLSDNYRSLRDKTSSPDLTHRHVVKEGDRLPKLVYDIYGSLAPIVMVARHNNLTSIRNIKPETVILFPPLP